jgi:hypothetical protein
MAPTVFYATDVNVGVDDYSWYSVGSGLQREEFYANVY